MKNFKNRFVTRFKAVWSALFTKNYVILKGTEKGMLIISNISPTKMRIFGVQLTQFSLTQEIKNYTNRLKELMEQEKTFTDTNIPVPENVTNERLSIEKFMPQLYAIASIFMPKQPPEQPPAKKPTIIGANGQSLSTENLKKNIITKI